MAMNYKTLAQAAPAGTSQVDLYTCPSSTNTLLSRMIVMNRTGTAMTFSATIAPLGAADTNAHYFAYTIPIGANEQITIDLGAGLQATDKVRFTQSVAGLTVHLYGVEIT